MQQTLGLILSTNVQYYGSGTGRRYCVCAEHLLCVHLPGGSTFLREMTPWPPY